MTVVAKTVHPDRWNPTTQLRKGGVVVHTSESGDTSAQSLCDFMAQPGDRPSPSGGFYGSSYHAVTTNDPADAPYVQVQGADHGPFSAPPLNGSWWHCVIPGRASQTRDEWLDVASLAGIHGVAHFIVDKSKVDGFPLERCSVSDLLAGDGGYCGHVDVANAWHKSDHYDPGPFFPWDVLQQSIDALTKEIPNMDTALLWRHPKYWNEFLIGAGPAINVSPAVQAIYVGRGIQQVVEAHDQMLKGCLAQAGLTTADLVPSGQ